MHSTVRLGIVLWAVAQALTAPTNLRVCGGATMILCKPTGRGPQPTVTQPAGSVTINPGSSIQSAVNANPNGTTFWLTKGIHTVGAAITPKTGNSFIGEYGAIVDGTGWSSSDTTQAAFRAHNEDIDDVTIRNLVIQNMPRFAIRGSSPFPQPLAYSTAGADRWRVENNEIANNLWGVLVGNDSVVRYNNIHHNNGHTQEAGQENNWGAGIHAILSQNQTIEYNEFAYNGANQRLFYMRNCIVRNNYFHHNEYNGLWFDGENTLTTVENNVFEDNPGNGIMYEVSGSAKIRGNTITRSGEAGILLGTSHAVEIYNNIIRDNWRSVVVLVSIPAIEAQGGGLEEFKTENISVHHNTIRITERASQLASYLIVFPSAGNNDATPWTSGSKNIVYANNAYTTPNLSGNFFMWGLSGSGFFDWSTWQAISLGGGVTQDMGSTYLAQ